MLEKIMLEKIMKSLCVFCSYFVLLAVFSTIARAGEDVVFLEAESVTETGGWVVDQQFMDQLGSPVLLAHGFGTPVADATTSVTLPGPGPWRLYVRTRNWVAPWSPNEAPGIFQILVNGQLQETVYGRGGSDWDWQRGDRIELEDGEHELTLTLRDLTGFDGRLDAMAFVQETALSPENTPDNTPKNVSSWLDDRRRAWTESRSVPTDAREIPYDLVVVGGGLAGTCAAIAAAREGLSVALIQDRPVLGGNGSTEVRVHLNGLIGLPPWPHIGRLTAQMGPLAGGNAREAEHYKDDLRRTLVQAEKGIDLFLDTHVNRVDVHRVDVGESEGHQIISAVYGQNIRTGQVLRFSGHLFADCTGDASVGFLAGADWRMGRESRDETGEELAPDAADSLVMGSSIQWNTVDTGKPVSFPELPWAIQFNEKTIVPLDHGDWDWEAGMNLDQIDDIERIRDIGLRAAYGHWSYMKNRMTGPWADKVRNRGLGWVSFLAGKRESRRLLGDLILSGQDLTAPHLYDDAAVVTTWSIDLHYPEEQNTRDFPDEQFRSIARQIEIKPYPIPYRCLYSRNVDNLFMAGRNISVTHVVLGTVRVMRTGGMMGEVVGLAAGLCRRHDSLPRAVYTDYLDEFRSLLDRGVPEQ